MPGEIVGLDDLVPDDIPFLYRGETWTLPGDIDTETTFRLAKYLRELGGTELEVEAGSASEKTHDLQRDITLKIEGELLKLFKVNHPDLDKLPFGVVGFRVVLMHVLARLGFGAEEPDPPKPPPRRPPKKR